MGFVRVESLKPWNVQNVLTFDQKNAVNEAKDANKIGTRLLAVNRS